MTADQTSTDLATATPGLRCSLLGPVEVRAADGSVVKVGGAKARGVLAMLALEVGHVVSTSKLIDGIWGEDPPTGVGATLQVHVSNLRKALGAGAVRTQAPGYVLDPEVVAVDLTAFDAELSAGREARAKGRRDDARRLLAAAVERWRGPALEDLSDAPFAAATIPWLQDRQVEAVELRSELDLELGHHREAVAPIEAALRDAPHRERLWELLLLALYRSGRQADALAAYQRARRTLGEGLGIDPGPELRRLEGAILAQDPALDLVEPPSGADESRDDAEDEDATFRAAPQVGCRFVVDGTIEHILAGVTVIGRHVDCEIRLSDPSISRRHCEVRPALGGYLLVDLGSTNGTLVNGVATVTHALLDGDQVQVGAHQLAYHSDPQPA